MCAQHTSAPPADLSRAVYAVWSAAAKTTVKKAELEATLKENELSLLRQVLNNFTNSAFFHVRGHMLLKGELEPVDAALAAADEAAQQAFKQGRIAMQVEKDGLESIIVQTVKQPLADFNTADVSVPAIPEVRLPSEAQQQRLAASEAQTTATFARISTLLPGVLEASTQHAEYLSSSTSGSAQPLSSEVRTILTRLNKDLAKGKKGGRKSTAKAASTPKKTEVTGKGGKAAKSPRSGRKSARLSAAPY